MKNFENIYRNSLREELDSQDEYLDDILYALDEKLEELIECSAATKKLIQWANRSRSFISRYTDMNYNYQ